MSKFFIMWGSGLKIQVEQHLTLFPRNLKKIDKIPDLAYFRHIFFGKNGVKCYMILILRPDLESSHHIAPLRTHLIWFSHFDFCHAMLFYLTTNGGRLAEWLERSHRLSRAVLCAGLWVRVPSPLGRAALPTTGGIGDCCYSMNVELYISICEYTGDMGGHWPKSRPALKNSNN